QNPDITGGTPITNTQGGATALDAKDTTTGFRADLEWVVGAHTLTVGIDNIKFEAENEGSDQVVDRWIYGRASGDIVPAHIGSAVSPGNSDGYYVQKLVFET